MKMASAPALLDESQVVLRHPGRSSARGVLIGFQAGLDRLRTRLHGNIQIQVVIEKLDLS